MSILKRFFISMLGSLAAIWISVMLFMLLAMVFAVSAVVSGVSSRPTVKVNSGSVLVLNLDSGIEERPAAPDFMSLINETPMPASLVEIVDAIDAAADDSRIEGISIECAGSAAGLATREAVREALVRFKKSGKWITAYGDTYTQGDYYIASAADELYINPIGLLELRGLATGIPFFKNLLDKVGVEMQVVKVGTFKSAVEPFILTSMSEANRLQTSIYLNSLWGSMVNAMAESRKVSAGLINQFADSLMMFSPADTLVAKGLVDGLAYHNEYIDRLKERTERDSDENLRTVTVAEYISAGADVPHSQSNKNKIAVYYACGDITESGKEGIASDRVVPDILELAEDDDIEAMVLRVNSGGGSAFASEQIWHALEVFKAKGKKFYVSMGDYAASGGYYISSGANRIFAQPMTITGSIGIFGMIPCAKELISGKLGVNVDYVSTNANAAGISILEPMPPFQRSRMQAEVNRGYELFTSRCAAGRGMSQDSIKAIAEGRVWDAPSALRIGLVDQLGSLGDAIEALASEMGYNKYQIVSYPDSKTNFWELISDLTDQMRAKAVKEELGIYYPVYQEVARLRGMDPVQARMELIIPSM